MRCSSQWRLALLCLAAATATCAPLVAASPLRDRWQEEGVTEFLATHRMGGGGGGGAGPAAADPMNCQNRTFTQRLNHFNRRDSRTWLQRYYVCDGYWRRSAKEPLFVFLGEQGGAMGRCAASQE